MANDSLNWDFCNECQQLWFFWTEKKLFLTSYICYPSILPSSPKLAILLWIRERPKVYPLWWFSFWPQQWVHFFGKRLLPLRKMTFFWECTKCAKFTKERRVTKQVVAFSYRKALWPRSWSFSSVLIINHVLERLKIEFWVLYMTHLMFRVYG